MAGTRGDNLRAARATGRAPGAFTLIELLVIIIILGMLITMVTPSFLETRKIAKAHESRSIITQLDKGAMAFKSELGRLPPSNGRDWPETDNPNDTDLKSRLKDSGLMGRHALAEALLGYMKEADDFQEGWGLRKAERGLKYGPFVSESMKTVGDPPAFVDAFGNEILYYCFDGAANTYNAGHNAPLLSGGKLPDIPEYLRDPVDPNRAFYRRDFVLVSPGADSLWEDFTATGGTQPLKPRTDDLANFIFRFKKK